MSYLKQEKWLKCGMCSRELKECNRSQSSFDAVNGATVLLISALHALNNKRHAVLVKANIMKNDVTGNAISTRDFLIVASSRFLSNESAGVLQVWSFSFLLLLDGLMQRTEVWTRKAQLIFRYPVHLVCHSIDKRLSNHA